MKRFYKNAAAEQDETGFYLVLDNKKLRTPNGHLLYIPETLRSPLITEWNGVKDVIKPSDMPFTQILMTAQDLYPEKKTIWHDEILSYLKTDLLCYWSNTPPAFVERQKTLFGKIKTKLEQKWNTAINISYDLHEIKQGAELTNNIESMLKSLSPILFTALYLTVIETGSTLLSAALFYKLIDTGDVYNTVFLDEIFKAEIYHEDIHGTAPDLELKQANMKQFINAAQIIFQSL